jgi:imidazoleglycerol phosphate synthase glutamine amidotransferase subunit HisH
VSGDPASIRDSKALVMPGDGAFAMAMDHWKKLGWIEPLKKHIADGGYFFGICLGYSCSSHPARSSAIQGASMLSPAGLSVSPRADSRFHTWAGTP